MITPEAHLCISLNDLDAFVLQERLFSLALWKRLVVLAATCNAHRILAWMSEQGVLDAVDEEGATAIQSLARVGDVQRCIELAGFGANPYKKCPHGHSVVSILKRSGINPRSVELSWMAFEKTKKVCYTEQNLEISNAHTIN